MPVPFVGRVPELDRLREELGAAASGSRIVLVRGEPGVGKTRLLAEFRASISSRATCLVGRGSPLGVSIPFSIVAEAVQAHLRTLPGERVRALVDERAHALAPALPGIRAEPGPHPSRLDTLDAFVGLFGALALERKLVLVLDDAHQADPSTWELLGYLGRNPIAAPVLVVAASRPHAAESHVAATSGSLLKDGLATEMRLGPLEARHVGSLAADLLGPAGSDPELAAWLFDRTQGNALFAIALLEELSQNPARRVVPASVAERVRASTLELPAGAREEMELAAVLGHSFSLRTIAKVDPQAGAGGLDDLVRRGLLIQRTEGTEVSFDFAHPLVQESVYEGIGPARRRELHTRAAADPAAPIAVRAHHAARGALPGDADAVAVIRRAAAEAEANQSHREALGHLRAALDLLPPDADERAALLDEVAWQAASASDHIVGLPALDELERLAGDDPVARGSAKMRRSSFLATGAGDLVAAEREASSAVRLFRDAGAEDRLPGALNELAWVRGEGGDLLAQVQGSREALALADRHGDEVAAMHALGALAHALGLLGRSGEALGASERGLGIARGTGDRSQIGWHAGVRAEILMNAGRLREAAGGIDGLLNEGPCPSDVAYFARARLNWFLGRWRLALSDCRAIGALHPSAPSVHSAWTLSLAGLAETAMGDPVSAAPHLAQAERAYAGRDFYSFSAHHDWAIGCARWLMGDVHGAHERLGRALAQLDRLKASPLLVQILPDAVDVAAAAGEDAEALELSRRLGSLAGQLGDAVAAAMAEYARSVVAPIADDRAERALRAADLAREAGLPFVRARALERAGRELRGSERVRVLTEAARVLDELGAGVMKERVLAALRAAGPAGRRASQGVGSLTPREREVADLARLGQTTRQIAGRLVLSERTVETHLAHVYAKLGISGRRDLRGAEPTP